MKKFTTINGDDEVEWDGVVLPDVIMEDILSRLPSKTLMKLRIVCKKWKIVISTSYFNSLHDEKSCKTPNLLLLSHIFSNDAFVLTTLSLTGDVLDQWNLPLRNLEMLPSQWGPKNLVCFVVGSKEFVLCNPSVREIFRLPRQPCSKRVGACGFCYLPSRNQHVIISLSGGEWQMITFSCINNLNDLHTYAWKPIKDNAPGKVMAGSRWGVSANGVLYWIGLTSSWSQCLLCLDLNKEKFFTVAWRDEIRRAFSWSLHELKGDLHLMTRRASTLSTLWKLDVTNQTWIKQYTIFMSVSNMRPLMECDDGELMFHDGLFLKWFGLDDEVFRLRRKGYDRLPHFGHMLNIKLHNDTLFL
ncbi:hypothetical protein F511_41986 [Dorcoceras hygrometricum]|uniref:F-box domain-containing protein n=1 Tax=Dorcoceras hygrometricum TaxID=472368 RepID=A0A2Z7AF19_9LAMI|nr:hypothetical protein F511_41986 [Dorcoceras hygrometricum]